MMFHTKSLLALASASFLISGCAVSDMSQSQQEIVEGEDAPKADETLAWNEVLNRAILGSTLSGPASVRSAAIMNVAMYDAFNSVHQKWEPIHFNGRSPRGISARAAIIGAAYRTLSAMFPTQQAKFDAAKAATVAALLDEDDAASVDAGLAWGNTVALDTLAWRKTDGFTASYPAFFGGTAAGQWRPVGTAPMAPLSPAFTAPFVVQSTLQFYPAKPRGLDSAEWVSDYNLVKTWGRKTGSPRTQYQTDQAFFYHGYAAVDWNEAAIQIAQQHHTTRANNSRNFVRLHVALADTMWTVFNAKRTFAADPTVVTWRPITAIRLGDTDGRPETVADPTWTPLITTPNHPEYSASHPASHGCGRAFLIALYGDEQEPFHISPQYNSTLPTPPGLPERFYTSVSAMAQEGLDARLFGGMHYPSSNEASADTGGEVALWVLDNVAKRVHGNSGH